MKTIAVIHFSPIELYPPTLNWLNLLDRQENEDILVSVCTMRPPAGYQPYRPATRKLRITRAGRIWAGNPLIRYWHYLCFYLAATTLLIRRRPEAVLYYESLSAFPAWFYKNFVRRKARIFIHYHEYTSPAEYENGMWLNRWQHRLEACLYPSATWISHTNADRIALFRQDHTGITLPEIRPLPNYPPASWATTDGGQPWTDGPLKLVYVGALSLETMYTRELAEWVAKQDGAVTWDIYSGNSSPDARTWLDQHRHPAIRLHSPVDYFRLPELLKQYHVGIILYNGHIPNYVFNAPNKLFEYWSCNLDVWLPDVLRTSLQYVNKDKAPRILSLDFTRLEHHSWQAAANHTGLTRQPSPYTCEAALAALLAEILVNLPE